MNMKAMFKAVVKIRLGFNSLQAWFFLSGLIFSNVHFLNRCLHIRLSYIHNHWLWLRKPMDNKIIIYSQDSECGKSPTWLEKLFSIQNYTFCFFSFNRKMLSGYCLETLKVSDVGWQEISACFTHLMKSEQFQCSSNVPHNKEFNFVN